MEKTKLNNRLQYQMHKNVLKLISVLLLRMRLNAALGICLFTPQENHIVVS